MAKYYYDPKIVIAAARAELGYIEKKSNKDLDDKTANAGDKNWTKYARDLDEIKYFNGRKNGITGWCAVFVCWLFWKSYGLEACEYLLCQKAGTGNCGAGPYYGMVYFKSKKRFTKTPQPGDQVFFLSASGGEAPSHTGLVVDVDSQYVYTIEGNTSVNGVAGCVAEKKYALNNSRIAGYGRPDWGEPPADEPDEDTGETEHESDLIDVHAYPEFQSEVISRVDRIYSIVALTNTGWYGVIVDGGIGWVVPSDVMLVRRGGDDDE